MWVEITEKTFRPNMALGVEWLNGSLQAFYSANPALTRLNVTLKMIKTSKLADVGPTLKSKAAECRHAAQFAKFLAYRHARLLQFEDERLHPVSAEYGRLAVEAAEAMVSYHEACSACVFSPDFARRPCKLVCGRLLPCGCFFAEAWTLRRHRADSLSASGRRHTCCCILCSISFICGARPGCRGAMPTRTSSAWSRTLPS
jgi:hypothetical protein